MNDYKDHSLYTTAVGTCGYQAPEVMQMGEDGRFLDRSQYTSGIDVYSFGLILFELALVRRAWDEVFKECRGPFYLEIMERVIAGERPRWSEQPDCQAPEGWRDITERCWEQDPLHRPTMAAVADELEQMRDHRGKALNLTHLSDLDVEDEHRVTLLTPTLHSPASKASTEAKSTKIRRASMSQSAPSPAGTACKSVRGSQPLLDTQQGEPWG